MNNINDEQRWVYPHPHPWFPQNQHNRFMPFPGRPMGDESYRHATVLSFLGRGPKGAKGDTFKYKDMTQQDKYDLINAFGTFSISGTAFSDTANLSQGSNSSVTFSNLQRNFQSDDVTILFLNGIALPQNAYLVQNGTATISLTPAISVNDSLTNEMSVLVFNFNIDTQANEQDDEEANA